METLIATTCLATELVWRPAAAPMHILALAVVLGLLAVAVYARTFRSQPARSSALLVMRLAVITAFGALLMGPSTIPPSTTESGRGNLTILLDTSGSMLTEDCAGRPRIRYAIDRWLTPEQLAVLSQKIDVRLVGFDASSRALPAGSLHQPSELSTGARSTNYGAALRDALHDARGDHTLLVIGDGHDTEQRSLSATIALARKRGAPIYTVAVGSTSSPRDLALVAVPRQEYLLPGEAGQIVVSVHQVEADAATTMVRLRGDGVAEDRPIRFAGRAEATIELPVGRDEPGVYEYTVSVDPVEGEIVTDNNSHTVFVEVTARRIRVLVLEGEPYWDTKFLAQALRSDPRIELTYISQVTQAPGKRAGIVTRGEREAVTVPSGREQFAAYDVVVLGRGIEHLLTPDAAGALAEHVATGAGHVVFARGRPYDADTPAGRDLQQRLAALEPVAWGRGLEPGADQPTLRLTPEGLINPAFAFTGLPGAGTGDQITAALPSLTTLPVVANLKPATRALAVLSSSGAPAIVTMNYGSGRVFAVLGEGLWQWSLLPPRLSRYNGAFDSFWSNAIRGLAMGGEFQPGQDISMKLGRTSVRLGDPQVIDVTLKLAAPEAFVPSLRLIGPDGQSHTASLGQVPGLETRYATSFTPQQTGAWSAVLDAPPLSPARQTRRFSVYDLNVERLRTAARPQVLRELAEQTGGEFFTADQEVDLADRLRRQRVAQIIPLRAEYAWDRAWVMAVLLGWMGIEWIARRQGGWL